MKHSLSIMKTAAFPVIAALAVSCAEDYRYDYSSPAENTVTLKCTAEVDGAPVSWATSSRIGLFCDALGLSNEPVTASAASAGTATGMFYLDSRWGGVDAGNYKFLVYYPYSETNVSSKLTGTLASQQSQAGTSSTHLLQYSLLAASVDTEAKATGEAVDVTLENVFDVMHISVSSSKYEGWNLESVSINVPGATLTGDWTYDIGTGSLEMTGGEASGITLNVADFTLGGEFTGYAVVSMPADASSCEVVVNVSKGDEAYSLTGSGVAFSGNMDLQIDGYDESVLEDSAVDLSQYDGRTVTANCYVAGLAGTQYKFPATVMGNGVTTPATPGYSQNGDAAGIIPETLSPASAAILWQTEPGLLTDVRLRSGYVYFTTAGETGTGLRQGNAVIAVYDAAGYIIWSWHIWVTDADLEGNAVTYTIHEKYSQYTEYLNPVLMDRNLGATTDQLTNVSGDNGSYGLMYQWGRKDPFPGPDDSNYTSTSYRSTYDASGEPLSPLPSSDSGSPSASEWSAVTVGFSDADKNRYPMAFVYTAPMWTAEVHDDYWGNPYSEASSNESGHKTIYDPCPPGWRVPHSYAWTGLTDAGNDALKNNFGQWHVSWGGTFASDADYQTYIKENGGLVFNTGAGSATYPVSGMIFNNGGKLQLYRVGNYVQGCWTNMPNTNNNAFRFYFDYANLNLRNNNARIIGHAVRCMKDTGY